MRHRRRGGSPRYSISSGRGPRGGGGLHSYSPMAEYAHPLASVRSAHTGSVSGPAGHNHNMQVHAGAHTHSHTVPGIDGPSKHLPSRAHSGASSGAGPGPSPCICP